MAVKILYPNLMIKLKVMPNNIKLDNTKVFVKIQI